MKAKLLMIFPYIIVFTTFNIIVALVYGVYGLIFKKKYVKLSHTRLSQEQKNYLTKIQFINVYRQWAKKYYGILKKYSVLFFVVSEVVFAIAMYLTGRCVLICRIVLFMDIFLLLLWGLLLNYFKKKSKELRTQHIKNLKKALKDFEELNNSEQEV